MGFLEHTVLEHRLETLQDYTFGDTIGVRYDAQKKAKQLDAIAVSPWTWYDDFEN